MEGTFRRSVPQWPRNRVSTSSKKSRPSSFLRRIAEVAHRGRSPRLRRRQSRAPPRERRGRRTANAPGFDARTLLYRFSGVDLTVIEGIESTTALVILSEIGYDLSGFPSVKHFTSWLGLCPNRKISAGKVKSSHVRPGPNRVAQALRLAARSLHSSKSALGAFLRRLKSRMGKAQAITATAHKLARLVYAVLKNGTEYVRARRGLRLRVVTMWTCLPKRS